MKNDKVLCKCGRFYHDPKFQTCWECYATTPAKVFKKYKQPETIQEYTSVKEYQEITGEI
jgi:hypothetical protein